MKSVNILVLHSNDKIILPPGEKGIYPDVGGDDDEEGEEEDLAVVRGVVDVRPVVRAAVN